MAKPKRAGRKAKRTVRPAARKGSGFKPFALHVTEKTGHNALRTLRAERPRIAAFGLESAQPSKLDPESAAKRILRHALASKAVPSLTAPKVKGEDSDFKSLGVETIPLTGTSVVKFRQQVKGIPVYGSLISVELGDDNECVSLNSNLATPHVKTHVARISPQDALKTAGRQAGYGRELPDATPVLNYYLDDKRKWHLAYIVENVRVRKAREAGKVRAVRAPLLFDYVVDAVTGSLIAELPRTPSMASRTDHGIDDLGKRQRFRIEINGRKKVLRDSTLNIETYDFGFRDTKLQDSELPGSLFRSPPTWRSAAVSAHANAGVVATFLRTVLMRNNIDGKGGRLISSVNCVSIEQQLEQPLEQQLEFDPQVWLNAMWLPDIKQMVYGQARFDGKKLRSLASSLDVVAHELFHGVTNDTAKLKYQLEPGALNESYSDIFAAIISNYAEPNIAKWNWEMGDGVSRGRDAFRDLQDPTRFEQPKHMRNFLRIRGRPNKKNDQGHVHKNSGIHNFAAYKVMTARDAARRFLFKPDELAAMFYIALTQQLSRQSTFADSKRAVEMATRSLFRKLPPAGLAARVTAVKKGFRAAGIR